MLRHLLASLLFVAALTAQALTVATYNVENYLVTNRLVEGVYREKYPKPEAEKAAVRQAIKAMAPDLLAVQEMGTLPFLEELQRDLKAEGLDYPHLALVQGVDQDRHVAVLSKVPFKDVRRHAQVPVTYLGSADFVQRGVLEVTIGTNEGDLTVFVLHLKSRRTVRPDDPESAAQRSAEAEAVRDLVLQRFPDPTQAKFVICGDWNDTRGSRAVRALQKRGDTVVGEILRAGDSRGDTWTHFYRREDSYSRIDYLLVSPALRPFVANKGTARVFDGIEIGAGSDHRPVFMQLALEAK